MVEINDVLGLGKLGTQLLEDLGKGVKYFHQPRQIKKWLRHLLKHIMKLRKLLVMV